MDFSFIKQNYQNRPDYRQQSQLLEVRFRQEAVRGVDRQAPQHEPVDGHDRYQTRSLECFRVGFRREAAEDGEEIDNADGGDEDQPGFRSQDPVQPTRAAALCLRWLVAEREIRQQRERPDAERHKRERPPRPAEAVIRHEQRQEDEREDAERVEDGQYERVDPFPIAHEKRAELDAAGT